MGENSKILDKLIHVSPISIELISIKDKKLICDNGWTANHLGYTKAEFNELSKNLFEKIVHPDDRDIQLSAYNSFFADDQPNDYKDFTIRVLRKDGKYDNLQIRISVMDRDQCHMPSTFLCMVMDVNDIIELNTKVSEQIRIMDQISFKNNHELRAPVATILGLINLIDHEEFAHTHVRVIIDNLKATVKKLDGVIREINEATY